MCRFKDSCDSICFLLLSNIQNSPKHGLFLSVSVKVIFSDPVLELSHTGWCLFLQGLVHPPLSFSDLRRIPRQALQKPRTRQTCKSGITHSPALSSTQHSKMNWASCSSCWTSCTSWSMKAWNQTLDFREARQGFTVCKLRWASVEDLSRDVARSAE